MLVIRDDETEFQTRCPLKEVELAPQCMLI